MREIEHRSEAQLDEPSGLRVLSDVAYLRVPPIVTLEADDERARAYAEAAWSTLAQNRDACAWIVDLRGNFGGSLAPMIAAIAPLLGRGRAVGYTTRDGATAWYTVGEDRITIDDTLVQRFDGPLSPLAGRRLAVLTDGFTASSGEGVLIALLRKGATSFGAPTAGVPTGNAGFAMPDGAVLLLTTSLGTGAHGELFDGAIEPMKPMAPGTGRHDDAIIDAAATSIDGCKT